MWLQGLSVSARVMMGFAIPRMPRKYAANPLWNHYCCGDGKWICLGMLQPDRYWVDFCRAIGRPELATDERFVDLRVRAANAGAAVEILDQVFATQPRDEWMRILRAGGDFIFTVVNSIDDLPDDPQVRANEYVTDFEHPQFGVTPVVGVPVRLSETPGAVRLPAPEFGQHTEEILTELLGYTWEQVGALKEQEVI
jgi:crotonobetainyl-CoA:carnitine CoA-transferase CaiB-like acyl-CoA transferase